MVEHGVEEDLELLQRINNYPPYASKDIVQLLAKTARHISEKVYDPHYVLRKGEEAYQQNKQAWDQQYAGQYIAIHRGQGVGVLPVAALDIAPIIRYTRVPYRIQI
jgi:hypothetical protein